MAHALANLFVILAMALAWPAVTRAQSVSPALGLAFPGAKTSYYPFIRQAGIGTVRLTADWSRLEPKPGQYKTKGLDGRIAALQAQGLQVFLTIETPKAWYSRPGTGQTAKTSAPADQARWAKFVSFLVERYDGDGQQDAPGLRRSVRYIQVANEFVSPNNKSGGWDGTNDELLAYINTAYGAAKAANPKVIFVLGGIAAFNLDIALLADTGANFPLQQRWSKGSKTVISKGQAKSPSIRALLDGRAKFILRQAKYDMADAHLYGPEGRDTARIAWLRKVARRPVLSSECGGPSLDYDTSYAPADHAAAVMRRNLGVLADGLPFCLWLGLGEEITTTYGNRRVPLFDKRRKPKPGVAAYRLLAQMLGSGRKVKRLGGNAGFLVSGPKGKFCVSDTPAAAKTLSKSCGRTTPGFCWDGQSNSYQKFNDVLELPQSCRNTRLVVVGRNSGALNL